MRIGMPLLMVAPLTVLLLLAWPHRWVARLTQITLVLGACEWLRAAAAYIVVRQSVGASWGRLAVILGTVAMFTLLSTLVFLTPRLRRRYKLS